MTDILSVLRAVEPSLEGLRRWRVERSHPGDHNDYAWATTRPEELFRCAAVLYPRFIEVEGAVVLADHYEPENWRSWRATYANAYQTAAMINHTHLDGTMPGDVEELLRLEEPLGELVAAFWQLAADRQFPGAGVEVTWTGYTLHVTQPARLASPAS